MNKKYEEEMSNFFADRLLLSPDEGDFSERVVRDLNPEN